MITPPNFSFNCVKRLPIGYGIWQKKQIIIIFFQSKYIFEDLIGGRYVVIWRGETTDLTIFLS